MICMVCWGIRAELISYTLLIFKQALILGEPSEVLMKMLMEEAVAWDVGLAGSVHTYEQFHFLFVKLTGGLV